MSLLCNALFFEDMAVQVKYTGLLKTVLQLEHASSIWFY